jgi:hypothetical protein
VTDLRDHVYMHYTNSFLSILASEEEMTRMMALWGKITAYAPYFKGPVPVEDGVKTIMNVACTASLENGSGGRAVPHTGTQRWL